MVSTYMKQVLREELVGRRREEKDRQANRLSEQYTRIYGVEKSDNDDRPNLLTCTSRSLSNSIEGPL